MNKHFGNKSKIQENLMYTVQYKTLICLSPNFLRRSILQNPYLHRKHYLSFPFHVILYPLIEKYIYFRTLEASYGTLDRGGGG